MNHLEDSVDRLAAETGFSGVVRVDRADGIQLAKAYGLAHRGCLIANAVDTQFAIASGTKGLTALTVVSLIQEGQLEPATTARSLLAEDLPLIDDEVTVEQLLAHRSGIGDYLDEEADHAVTDYVLPVPVHELAPPSSTCACSAGTRASSRLMNGSPTATAATSCSRCSPIAPPAHPLPSWCSNVCADPRACTIRSFCAPTNSPVAPRSATSRPTGCAPTSFIFRSGEAEMAAATPPRPTSTPLTADHPAGR